MRIPALKTRKGSNDNSRNFKKIDNGLYSERSKKIIGVFGKLEVVFLKKPCHYFIITAYWR